MQNRLNDLSVAILQKQSFRYIINGLVATAIHFFVLTFNLKVLGWTSAGVSNLVAAGFGIASSFIGNRFYVFSGSSEPLFNQVYRFLFLYLAIACLHGAFMYAWVDVSALHYIPGFIVATFLQVFLSYWGNKFLVFKT
jgi:putative flippase GtrA